MKINNNNKKKMKWINADEKICLPKKKSTVADGNIYIFFLSFFLFGWPLQPI